MGVDGPGGPKARLFAEVGDDFDFAAKAHGELLHREARARGLRDEVLFVDGVEGLEVRHVGEEARRLYDAREIGAGGGEHFAKVRDRLFGLRGDVVARGTARFGDDADLARREDEVARTVGLRVGTDGGGRLVGMDLLHVFAPWGDREYPARIVQE